MTRQWQQRPRFRVTQDESWKDGPMHLDGRFLSWNGITVRLWSSEARILRHLAMVYPGYATDRALGTYKPDGDQWWVRKLRQHMRDAGLDGSVIARVMPWSRLECAGYRLLIKCEVVLPPQETGGAVILPTPTGAPVGVTLAILPAAAVPPA